MEWRGFVLESSEAILLLALPCSSIFFFFFLPLKNKISGRSA